MNKYKQDFNDAREYAEEFEADIDDSEATGVAQSIKQPGGKIHMGTIKPVQHAVARAHKGKNAELIINDYINLDPHTLFSPIAAGITGFDPNDHVDNPDYLSQSEFAVKLMGDLIDTKILYGYNIFAFDREVYRHCLHEKLLYPYPHSHMECIVDIYLVLQSINASNPNLIKIPQKENGNVEMRQVKITKANGIEPKSAHTADGDVLTLAEFINFLWEKAPEHMTAAVMCGSKSRAMRRLTEDNFVVYGYVERFTRKGRVHVLCALADSGANKIMGFDIGRFDPSDFTSLDPTEISKLMGKTSSPFNTINLSHHPIFIPPHYCKAAGISETEAERRAGKITDEFRQKVQLALSLLEARDWPVAQFPECRLYSDSFPKDLHLSENFLNGTNEQRKLLLPQFSDQRAIEFAKRIIAIDQGSNESEFYEEYMNMCRERFFDTSDTLPALSYQGAIAQIDWLIEWGYSEEVVNPIGNYIEDMKERLQ